jgi:hypothetical protein
MLQEQFPSEVDFQTEHTRMEFQGNSLTCTTFGGTSALEAVLHRLGQFVQLSPRFLWYNMRGYGVTVESMANALEREGTCLDSFCPYLVEANWPYNTIGVYDPPTSDAWHDAKTRLPKGIKPIRIAGKESVMRALAQGSALTIVKVLGGGLEHCVAVIGYNAFGIKVHDSGNNVYWQPWSDLEPGGNITQLYRWEGLPLVPHPDYIEGDLPTLIGGILSLPKAMVYVGFPQPSIHFKDVQLKMVTPGILTSGNEDVQDIVFWHSLRATLYLPKLIVDSTILHKVKIVGPTATLVSAEEG